MKITTFDRPSTADFQRRALAALQSLATECGVTLRAAGGSFGGELFNMKIEAKINDAGVVEDAQRARFRGLCDNYGLEPSDYGARFSYNGKSWQLTGFAPSRPKYCIEAKCLATGQTKLLGRNAVEKIKAARGSAASSRGAFAPIADATMPAPMF